jgi:hypothetical protein
LNNGRSDKEAIYNVIPPSIPSECQDYLDVPEPVPPVAPPAAPPGAVPVVPAPAPVVPLAPLVPLPPAASVPALLHPPNTKIKATADSATRALVEDVFIIDPFQ